MTSPSTPASAMSRLVPAPSRRCGMPRRRQPSRATSMDWVLAISAKNSAGPPMPNDVRVASGSPLRTPGSPRSQARLDSLRQLIAQLSDVTRAHQEENVVWAYKPFQRFAGALKRTHVHSVGNHVRQVAGLDPGGVVLAGAVDVHDQDAVGGAKRTREVLEQRREPRVAVRLKHDDEAAMAQLASRLQRGPNLGRMVRVVVIDGGALEHAEELETPGGARETFERTGHVGETHAQLERHRRCRGRVLHVVPAWLPEVDPSELVSGMVDRKGTVFVAAVVGALAEAVRDAPGRRLERSRAFVVRRQNRHALGRPLGHELRKELAPRLDIPEVIRVVELDVGDDPALGVMEDEGAVGLVHLGHESARAARAGARAVADQNGGVEPGLGEDVARHVSHGGLARAAADRDDLIAPLYTSRSWKRTCSGS